MEAWEYLALVAYTPRLKVESNMNIGRRGQEIVSPFIVRIKTTGISAGIIGSKGGDK